MTNRKKSYIALTILGILVFISTLYILIMPAVSKSNIAVCGTDEHIHTSECFRLCSTAGKNVLVCNMSDSGKTAHIHDTFCYENDNLICPIEEYSHTHDENCYDENNTIICGVTVHQHSEQCFSSTEEYGETEVLICGKNAHVHTAQCNEVSPEPVNTPAESPAEYAVQEIAYDDADFYEPQNANAPPADDIDIGNACDITPYITAISLKYRDEYNKLIEITDQNNNDIPIAKEYRLDVSYNFGLVKNLAQYDNKLVLRDRVPEWLALEDNNLIYTKKVGGEEEEEIAGRISVKNGTILVTIYDDFIEKHEAEEENPTMSGTFYVYGKVEWRKLSSEGNEIDLPELNVKVLDFEDDLPEKYGKVTVEKSISKNIVSVGNKDYLEYTLTVQSMEEDFDIKNIIVKDTFTANNKYVSYAEITANPYTLGNSKNGVTPYETRTGGAGKVSLNDNVMEWNIGTLDKGETRVLTYYAELINGYTGGESKGTVSNKADLFSGEYPKDTADSYFTPIANLDVTKEISGTPQIDETGTGTITYKVRVVSWANNSYTLKDVRINDIIKPEYKNFIDSDSVNVQIINETYTIIDNKVVMVKREPQYQTIEYGENKQLSYTIPELKAGDAVMLTYTMKLKNILTAENNDIQFKNTANIYLDNNGMGSAYVFKDSFVDYTIRQSSWIRKISGVSLDNETSIAVGDNVRNYNGSEYNNPPENFTVPKNSRQYQIIVNEGGAWDLSSATLHDNFRQMNNTDYMAYTGFLCIEEFTLDETDKNSIKSENDEKAISRLNDLIPTETVWIDINGKTSFDLTPENYGLDKDKHTYLLTYYAKPQNVENIGSISVTNEFTIYGDVGNGAYITAPGILCSVSNTVSGAIHYNATKEAWYLTNDKVENASLCDDYNKNNGALYWIIKVDGTVNAGFSIDDIPVNDTTGYANHVFCPDSVAGIFRGSKDIDIAETYNKYGDMLADTQNFEKLTGNDSNFLIGHDQLKFKYKQIDITDIDQLDGKSFIIANVNGSGSLNATMGNTQAVHSSGTKGISVSNYLNIASSPYVAGNHIMGMPETIMWTFEKVKDNKFYIKNGSKYLEVKNSNVSLSDTPVELTVKLSPNKSGQIRILNNNACLTWAGIGGENMMFSAWGETNEDSRQISLIELTGDDYLWTSQNGYRATITFQKDIPLTDDEALYVIVRTVNHKEQDKTSHTNNRYGNQFQINDIIKGTEGTINKVEYIQRFAGSVMKTGEAVYSYDEKSDEWSVAYADGNFNRLNNVWDNFNRLGIKYNNTETSVKKYLEQVYGSGTYAEWYITANWDGTLSDTVDICDTLPENFEPICISLYDWTETQVKNPQYPEIPVLENDSNWQKNTTKMNVMHAYWSKNLRDFNYYYNQKTNQVRWRITNIVGEGDSDPDGVQNYNNSLGFIVICKVKDTDILMNGSNTVVENNVTIESGSFMDSDNDVICIDSGASLRKNFEGNTVTDNGNNNYQTSMTKIPFVIEVNPLEEKLSTSGILPLLIDKMSDRLEIDASTISVKYTDGTDVQGCSYVADGQTITFSGLLDERAIKISYMAKITKLKDSESANISNMVYWDGYDEPQNPQINNANMLFKSSGNINLLPHPKIHLIKTENGNDAKFLAGAKFELMNSNKQIIYSGITDSKGEIIFQNDNNNTPLDYDTIYYIKEISAPSGYELDSTEKCIVVLNTKTEQEFNGIENITFMYADDYGDYSNKGECEYKVKNEKKKIKLNKDFEGGSQINGIYSFGIYEGNNLDSTPLQTLTIEYSENSEPVYRLDGIAVKSPEFTCAQSGIQYTIYELCNDKPITQGSTAFMNGHTFEVSYSNNYVSLANNSITVTNRVIYYELPITGGKGTSIFYIISTPIIIAVVFLLVKKSSRKRNADS
ncbi:MAG: prealbumin-like fold domain-containing protein [Ruminococcus flavefaciens]|nr:prealbumin-like fold domain-containing protein [Ruminococcus flavefaciens]